MHFVVFFSCKDWHLNSGLHSCKAGTLPLEPLSPVHFALVILEMGSQELFSQAGLEQQSSLSQSPK
jgi:hypothetical protein